MDVSTVIGYFWPIKTFLYNSQEFIRVTFWDFSLCINNSAPGQFLTSEAQHPEAAWPDSDHNYNHAG